MNRTQAKRLLPIMEAFANGKDIEYLSDRSQWRAVGETVYWDAACYRIKPEPQKFWVVWHNNAVVSFHNNDPRDWFPADYDIEEYTRHG